MELFTLAEIPAVVKALLLALIAAATPAKVEFAAIVSVEAAPEPTATDKVPEMVSVALVAPNVAVDAVPAVEDTVDPVAERFWPATAGPVMTTAPVVVLTEATGWFAPVPSLAAVKAVFNWLTTEAAVVGPVRTSWMALVPLVVPIAPTLIVPVNRLPLAAGANVSVEGAVVEVGTESTSVLADTATPLPVPAALEITRLFPLADAVKPVDTPPFAVAAAAKAALAVVTCWLIV